MDADYPDTGVLIPRLFTSWTVLSELAFPFSRTTDEACQSSEHREMAGGGQSAFILVTGAPAVDGVAVKAEVFGL